MKEFDLISKYFAPLASNPAALDLLDDVALLTPPKNKQLVLTSDIIAQDIHYLSDTTPADIAHKLCAVNLSDLAAKGARPFGAMLNFAPLQNCGEAWIADFAQEFGNMATAYDFSLLGGDSVAMTRQAHFALTLIGTVDVGQMPLRRAAQRGDDVYVSGQIGCGALGLRDAKACQQTPWAAHYRRPIPRLELGCQLQPLLNASADVSDGLVADLTHICHASACGMDIQLNDIPFADSDSPNLLNLQLTGGDDYELIFTAAQNCRTAIRQVSERVKTPVTLIGSVIEGDGVRLLDGNNKRHKLDNIAQGWQHF